MKLLIINTTYNKGGAAQVARGLFQEAQKDFDTCFAYGRGDKVSDKNVFKFGNSFENIIHLFLVRFLGLEGYGTYFSTRKLIKFIKREQFDLINLHNLHGYYLDFFTLVNYLKKNQIPVVWTLHDEWPITWLPAHSLGCKHCLGSQGSCTNTYSYPRNYFPIFKNFMLKKKHEVFGKDWSPVITCPSYWLAGNVSNSYLKDKRIEVISNGINTDIFKPYHNQEEIKKRYNIKSDQKIIVFSAASLQDKNKGIEYIVEAAKILESEPYIFLGLGQGEIIGPKNISTTGYIQGADKVAEILAAADLFCFTSQAETFSLAAAEALSCGVPVVGFELPVIKELVSEYVGLLGKINETPALAQNIKYLLENETERLNKGKAGRELIVNNYSSTLFYQKYRDLFKIFDRHL